MKLHAGAQNGLWSMLVVCLLIASASAGSVSSNALQILRNELRTAERWVKVHAAEGLLANGHPQGVADNFRRELAQHGDETPYRIGIWRVLTRAAEISDKKTWWAGKIKAVFLDPDAPDRLHAIETLGKLKWPLTDKELAAVKRYAAATQVPFAYWVLAQHDVPQAVETLERQTRSEDPMQRLRAVYCLRILRPRKRAEWLAGGGMQAVKEQLHSKDAGERRRACRILTEMGIPSERHLLMPLLDDPDADVRVYAATGVLRLEPAP